VEIGSDPLLSAKVTPDGDGLDELADSGDDPFATGWWVGADDNWHPPDEPFGTAHSVRPHLFRRIVIAAVAVAIALVTTLSVLVTGGAVSTPAATSPSASELASQVRQIVNQPGNRGLQGVADVQCHLPGSWSSGATFTCDVFGPSQARIGAYVGTVEPTTSDGTFRWNGAWKPLHRSTLT
jgi:hypothetical protein